MASFNEVDIRNVLPNWRGYSKTAKIGEFQASKKYNYVIPLFSLDEYISAWNENKSVPFAADLISAAITNGQKENVNVIEAAQFIVAHSDECSSTQLLCAKSLIPNISNTLENKTELSSKLSDLQNKNAHYHESIRILKQRNILFPYNAINYCELARYYTNLGQTEKALKTMLIAVQLAPESRFISRSAARLYSHLGEYDLAHKVLVKNPWLLTDPWIIASEIAVNSAMGRGSRYVKKGQELIDSGKYTPFSCSELASAIATLEMKNGNRKKCRHYMNLALQEPNDNSLAQAEWIIHEDNNIGLTFGDYSYLQNKAEADCRYAYFRDDYTKALSTGIDWIADYPFETNPIYFTAEMAYTYLREYKIAIDVILLGLRANPDDIGLINNLAYSYALSGQLLKAESTLEKVNLRGSNVLNETKVCLTATKGLIEYRKGNIETGQLLYLQAMTDAKNLGCEQSLIEKAMLNFIREEVLFNPNYDKKLLSLMENITSTDKELNQLKNDVLVLIKT